jgi:hypothetical protein
MVPSDLSITFWALVDCFRSTLEAIVFATLGVIVVSVGYLVTVLTGLLNIIVTTAISYEVEFG